MIMIMMIIVTAGGYLGLRFEKAVEKKEQINQIVQLLQKVRIAEKAYRKYYQEGYQQQVYSRLNTLMSSVVLIDMVNSGPEGAGIIPGLLDSYKSAFENMVFFHVESRKIESQIETAMNRMEKSSRAIMDKINHRQFLSRTSVGKELDPMEYGMVSPLQDVSYLAISIKLSHKHFLLSNQPEHLKRLFHYVEYYGPGLMGAIEQGAAYLNNPFYQRVVKQINADLQTALELLNNSRSIMENEERSVQKLDALGNELFLKTEPWLKQADLTAKTAIKQVRFVVGSLLVSGSLFIAVTISVLIRSISRNLEHMVATTRKIQQGNLSLKVCVNTRDEFGALADAFNEMTDHLGRSLESLRAEIDDRKAAEKRLRQISRRVVTHQEKERAAISRELHDELGQVLTALKIDAVWLHRNLGAIDDRAGNKLQTMCDGIDKTIEEVRSLAYRLRPKILEDMGLGSALEWLIRDFQARTGIVCKLTQSQLGGVDDVIKTTAYRIIQECLTNVTRHSYATTVMIDLVQTHDALRVSVADNGRGFKNEIESLEKLGIRGMQERAHLVGGSFLIQSALNNGCCVEFALPLEG